MQVEMTVLPLLKMSKAKQKKKKKKKLFCSVALSTALAYNLFSSVVTNNGPQGKVWPSSIDGWLRTSGPTHDYESLIVSLVPSRMATLEAKTVSGQQKKAKLYERRKTDK